MPTGRTGAARVDSFTGSPLERARQLFAPTMAVRIAARLRRSKLDHALIAGADPAESPLLAARAAQLNGQDTRARIADGLERIACAGLAPSRVHILPSRAAVEANRSELLELAGLLRRGGPVYARGVAMLEITLTDGAGPAYTDRRGEALTRQLQLARAGLAG